MQAAVALGSDRYSGRAQRCLYRPGRMLGRIRIGFSTERAPDLEREAGKRGRPEHTVELLEPPLRPVALVSLLVHVNPRAANSRLEIRGELRGDPR